MDTTANERVLARHRARLCGAVTAGVVAIALSGCQQDSGEWSEAYENGKKKTEYQYYTHPENSKRVRHGYYNSYNPDGGYLTTGTYRDGVQTGTWTWYYGSGPIEEEGAFKHGKKDGRWVSYYKNRNKKKLAVYEAGKEDGKWVTYFENGRIDEAGSYIRGKKDGEFVGYYADGQPRYEGTFKDGKEDGGIVWHGVDALKYPENLNLTAPGKFDVEFRTSAGSFVVSVQRDLAPNGVNRFYNLVMARFYSDCRFFRVVPDFMAQFGYHGNSDVTAAWLDATIQDDPVKLSNKRGTITFAARGGDTRTTQLFINLKDNSHLDGQGFASLGTVTQGMEVVDSIYGGYRETPSQEQISRKGNSYLVEYYPEMDYIEQARVVD